MSKRLMVSLGASAISLLIAGAAGAQPPGNDPSNAPQCIEGCGNFCQLDQGQTYGTQGYKTCLSQCQVYYREYCDGAIAGARKDPISMTVIDRARLLAHITTPIRQSYAPTSADQ